MNEPIPPRPPTPPDDALPEARSGTVGLLIVLAAAFTVSQFYRTAPAVIGPELRSGLALSPAQLGLAAGAFFIAFSLMHVPIGVLLDRYGPRRVMAAMLAIASAGAALFSQAGGAAGLVAAQLL
ncbi:MAG: MFS transporter, partial [Rhodospirillaceae bacterium]|nr:MFS transporter [Rhodospirillaceae bacterium]